jgi:putative ABC transport system permease protein
MRRVLSRIGFLKQTTRRLSSAAKKAARRRQDTHQLRLAVRVLRTRPLLMSTIVAVLTLGIAVNGGMFSIVSAVLLWPLPFLNPESVVVIRGPSPQSFVEFGGPDGFSVFEPSLHDTHVFASIAAAVAGGMNLGADPPIRLRAAAATPDFFRVLGVEPFVGTPFPEPGPGTDRVVLVSYHFWRDHLSSAPDAVGRVVTLNNRPFVVCGVMPRDVDFPANTDIWIPSAYHSELSVQLLRPIVIGRLQVSTDVRRAHEVVRRAISGNDRAVYPSAVRVETIRQALVGDIQPILLFLGVSALLVLLTACINASSLMLVRVAERRREFALKLALGASSRHLVTQVACESLIIAAISGVLALLAVTWTIQLIRGLVPPTVHGVAQIGFNRPVVLATIGLVPVTALLFGWFPILSLRHRTPMEALRVGETATIEPILTRFRSVLVVGQVSIAVVLVCVGATVLKTVMTLAKVDLGIREDDVSLVELALPRSIYSLSVKRVDFYERLEASLRQIPGVSNVGFTSHLLLTPNEIASATPIALGTAPPTRDRSARFAIMVGATPGYFPALGIEVLAGRTFTAADLARRGSVAIVSSRFVRQVGATPSSIIGQQIRLGAFVQEPNPRQIVGVVGDVRMSGPESDYTATVYTPLTDNPPLLSHVVLKTSFLPDNIGLRIRRAVAAVDPSIPIFNIRSFPELRKTFFAERHFAMQMVWPFASLAVALAVAGVFGLISYTVELRKREFGIRMAVGASPRRIRLQMLRSGAYHTSSGIAIGLVASLFVLRWMSVTIIGLIAVSAWSVLVLSASLFGIGTLATVIPAQRSSRVDPALCLRTE